VPFPFDRWPQFGIGVLLFDVLSEPSRRSRVLWSFLILAAAACYMVARTVPDTHRDSSRVQTAMCIGFAAVLAALHPFEHQIRKLRPVELISVIGVFSYSLYLTHPIVLGFVMQLGKKLHVTERGYIFVFAAEMLASVLFALGFYQLFEKPFISKRRRTVTREAIPDPSLRPAVE
jgi:exopolysaccharide production protein ExoZ